MLLVVVACSGEPAESVWFAERGCTERECNSVVDSLEMSSITPSDLFHVITSDGPRYSLLDLQPFSENPEKGAGSEYRFIQIVEAPPFDSAQTGQLLTFEYIYCDGRFAADRFEPNSCGAGTLDIEFGLPSSDWYSAMILIEDTGVSSTGWPEAGMFVLLPLA